LNLGTCRWYFLSMLLWYSSLLTFMTCAFLHINKCIWVVKYKVSYLARNCSTKLSLSCTSFVFCLDICLISLLSMFGKGVISFGWAYLGTVLSLLGFTDKLYFIIAFSVVFFFPGLSFFRFFLSSKVNQNYTFGNAWWSLHDEVIQPVSCKIFIFFLLNNVLTAIFTSFSNRILTWNRRESWTLFNLILSTITVRTVLPQKRFSFKWGLLHFSFWNT